MGENAASSPSSPGGTPQERGPDRASLAERLARDPADLEAGLALAGLHVQAGEHAEAVDVLAALWRTTRRGEAADALAEAAGTLAGESRRQARDRDRDRDEDAAVVARLAGLLRALQGPKGVLVDTLEYDIIGGLAIDATLLGPIIKAGFADRAGKPVVFFSGKSANPALVEMLARELPVFRDESFPRLMPYCGYDWQRGRYVLSPDFARDFFGRHAPLFAGLVEFTHSTNGRAYCRTPEEGALGLTLSEPQVRFTPEELERGARFLREALGMGPGDWYVCVYARDGAYYAETPQSPNWFRNSDIATFLPAVDEILARGGRVVRVGERVGKRLDHPGPEFLDYSNSPWRDPFLDIYLLAHCRFLLGTPSGLCHVAQAFRRPELMVNSINMCTITSSRLYIPKIVRDVSTGHPLPYARFLERLYGYGDIGLFLENGLNQRDLLGVFYEDNTPEDIRAATVEMFDRLEGRHVPSEKALSLSRVVREMWRPWSRVHGKVELASCFLDAHAELFDPEGGS